MNRNPLSHLLALSLLLAVASVPGVTVGQELQSLSGRVWVTNRTLNNIALFDAATGMVRGTAPVGRAPTGIVAPPGTGKVYVSDEGSNTVSVLSASSLKLLATIPTGPRPHHMGHDPSGRYVYVAEFGSNQVGMIDTRDDRRLMGLAASASPTARTHAPFAAADGTLYAVSEGSNELAAIDPGRRSTAMDDARRQPAQRGAGSRRTAAPPLSPSATRTRSRWSTCRLGRWSAKPRSVRSLTRSP